MTPIITPGRIGRGKNCLLAGFNLSECRYLQNGKSSVRRTPMLFGSDNNPLQSNHSNALDDIVDRLGRALTGDLTEWGIRLVITLQNLHNC